MWIVKLALRRPYTFTVLALLILILGPIVILRTPTDVFPEINIPVVSIVWNYTGLSSEDMGNRITSVTERALTTLVDDIEHIESQSLNGIAVVKVFFQPHADINKAIAQVTAISQTQLRQLPPGTTPPLVITYSASTVPILQLALSGQQLSEQQLFDNGVNFIRTRLITVPGAAIPYPYGGKQRQVQVDLNTAALQAKGLSPLDVVNAVGVQNLILPSGTTKIGPLEYDVDMNASPKTVAELNDLPIKTVGSSTIYIRDVAHVRDGFPPQTNIARVNGQRAVLLTVQKAGSNSTLDIVSGIKGMLPDIKRTLPDDLNIRLLADQSLFVRASIQGVVREAIIAACLTGLMILIFLGSWRSTVIIAVSIPLSILTSIICLSALGETINIMTLGGLALAVGILVDDATVEIENINRNIALGKEVEHAILDGAQQIAVPAFVATLAICIVFVPMFLLSGVARYLFVPLGEAVVFDGRREGQQPIERVRHRERRVEPAEAVEDRLLNGRVATPDGRVAAPEPAAGPLGVFGLRGQCVEQRAGRELKRVEEACALGRCLERRPARGELVRAGHLVSILSRGDGSRLREQGRRVPAGRGRTDEEAWPHPFV